MGNDKADVSLQLINRRDALKGAAATLAAAKSFLPYGAFAQAAGPETTKAALGYIALTDSAPLIIAKEKGLYAKHGVPDVEVSKQASWGATRRAGGPSPVCRAMSPLRRAGP
jgi:nitrate/nitrite transport system substrate-binding protein